MDRLSDYRYDLPEELIAQRPLEDRAASRMLWLRKESDAIEHRSFRDIVEVLLPGDLLVVNDTRVSALRLVGKRPTGGAVEALLLAPLGNGRLKALVKPGRRLRTGAEIDFDGGLKARVEEDLGEGLRALRFDPCENLEAKLKELGSVPLPPYVHERLGDPERYQTVYAETAGSSAAPTAGLHFTLEVLSALKSKGVSIATVTLDVGMDTFRPVASENLDLHAMHGERCELPVETAKAVAECRGRVIAVGTTAVRTLESFAKGRRDLESGSRVSRLFIRPGFEFKIVDGLLTNFHLPGTTMLMLVSALAGRERLLAAYDEAIRARYRFLSFGDAMLVL